MGKLLKQIQKNHDIHTFLRNIYGRTIGFWWFKKWYITNVGLYNGERRTALRGRLRGEDLAAQKMITYINIAAGIHNSLNSQQMTDHEAFLQTVS